MLKEDRRLRFPKKRILIGLIAIAALIVVILGGFFWQYISASVTESESTVKSFIYALNNYDTNASWELMSPTLQKAYGTMGSFNETVLSGLRQSGWHAEFENTITVKGNFTFPGSLIPNSACIVTLLRITENGLAPYNKTYTFELVKPLGWKIDKWLAV
jgi:hypothetical protein